METAHVNTDKYDTEHYTILLQGRLLLLSLGGVPQAASSQHHFVHWQPVLLYNRGANL